LADSELTSQCDNCLATQLLREALEKLHDAKITDPLDDNRLFEFGTEPERNVWDDYAEHLEQAHNTKQKPNSILTDKAKTAKHIAKLIAWLLTHR
jgi:hypothetical protein